MLESCHARFRPRHDVERHVIYVLPRFRPLFDAQPVAEQRRLARHTAHRQPTIVVIFTIMPLQFLHFQA